MVVCAVSLGFKLDSFCHREGILVSCAINEVRLRRLGPARTLIVLHPTESFVGVPLPKTFSTYHAPFNIMYRKSPSRLDHDGILDSALRCDKQKLTSISHYIHDFVASEAAILRDTDRASLEVQIPWIDLLRSSDNRLSIWLS